MTDAMLKSHFFLHSAEIIIKYSLTVNLSSNVRKFTADDPTVIPLFTHSIQDSILIELARLLPATLIIVRGISLFYAIPVTDGLPCLSVFIIAAKDSI